MNPQVLAQLENLKNEIQKNIKAVTDDLMERMKYEMKEKIAEALEKREKEMRTERGELLDDIARIITSLLDSPDSQLRPKIQALAQKLKEHKTDQSALTMAIAIAK